MSTPADLPAPVAVRRIALGLLDSANQARRRLGDAADAEALHDLRVALRRLRGLLRQFRPYLDGQVRKKDRRRLRRLAARTARGRDLEVQLAWLTAEQTALQASGGPDVQWFVEATQQQLESARAGVRDKVSPDLRRLRKRLAPRLTHYCVDVREERAGTDPSFARAVGKRAARLAAELRAALDSIAGPGDQDGAHRARLAGEKLRYLLEPVRGAADGLDEAVGWLRRLQDQLGDLCDVHATAVSTLRCRESLSPDDPRSRELDVLLGRLHQRHGLVFAELQAEWLGERVDARCGQLDRVTASLRGEGAEGPGVEIERKYLLDGFPALPSDASEPLDVEQGWLPGTRLLERLRRVRTAQGEEFFRTVKLGRGVSRIEVEEAAEREVFDTMWPLTEGRRIRKTRHRVPVDGFTWEIDRFTDLDLVLAEIELPAADSPVRFPDWLAPYVVREVTDDPAYLNFNLAS
jgi:CHAD domain-containing protein/CYTH domain-containing protein